MTASEIGTAVAVVITLVAFIIVVVSGISTMKSVRRINAATAEMKEINRKREELLKAKEQA